MTREGVTEIIPGRLYQRGHFLTWSAERKQKMLAEHGIGVVVNLWQKVDPDLSSTGVLYVNWPIPGGRPPAFAEEMVSLLVRHLRMGIPVLVHCEAGVNRSVWLCARLLHAYDGVLTGPQTVQAVANLMPGARMRPGLKEDIERL
jgi:protein-tyrosine phosphatase